MDKKMKVGRLGGCLFIVSAIVAISSATDVLVSDRNITYSPYNWHREGSSYAQTPNPGAYLKLGFTGTSLKIKLDASTFRDANIPADQYPLVRYSVDGGPGTTVQLTPKSDSLGAASKLSGGTHTLLFQYVSGYVFLDFWSPVNAIRVTGFTLDDGARTYVPTGGFAPLQKSALFLGDSITNGDDDIATFKGGITNAVDTQDATIGYPSFIAAATGCEFGVVAYGGASWDSNAADGHTPGLMSFYSMIDKIHSRLVDGKLSPIPSDIYINMGENRGPGGDEVPSLLASLRAASSSQTNIFVIVPFSGRARGPVTAGVTTYKGLAPADSHVYLIDLGDNPYLPTGRATMMSVDGQHPLAVLHGLLGAQIVQARSLLLGKG
jgi:hypothetical protein